MSRAEHVAVVAEWEEGVCTECGSPYPQRHSYERLCPFCYKNTRDYNILWGDQAFLWSQEQIKQLRSQLQEAQQALRAKKSAPAGPEDSGLRGDLLRQVISLCHPDHHGGSPKATEVTKQLLALRAARERKKK